MRLLLTNDDGIHADGLRALWEAVRDMAEVVVVAPDHERSAVGHAITISTPIHVQRFAYADNVPAYAVSGTPADAAKLALFELVGHKPDLVLSGINQGSNLGISVLYSGTVAAASEGPMIGIPGIAFSLNTHTDPHWGAAIDTVRAVLRRCQETMPAPSTLLNVNIPHLPPEEIKGCRVVPAAESHFVDTFERRTNPRGQAYYWMDGYMNQVGPRENTDIAAVEDGYVAITPLRLDPNQREALADFGDLNRDA